MMKRFAPLFCLALILILAGCIAVRDFGAYWGAGTMDPQLEGKWENMQKNTAGVRFSNMNNMYKMEFVDRDGTEPKVARTLKVGNNNFLMVKKNEDDKNGDLIAYAIQGDQMAFFSPNRDRATEFVNTFPNSGYKVSRTSITIDVLDAKSFEVLQAIASDPKWWTEMQRFTRQ